MAFALLALVPHFPPVPVADGMADGTTAYVSDARGDVVALDLKSGKTRWSLGEPGAKVLALADDRLAVWEPGKSANELVAIVAGAADGKVRLRAQPIEMPSWASTAPGYGRALTVLGRFDGDTLVVDWWAEQGWAGGAAPAPGYRPSVASGETRVDPSGHVQTGPAPAPPLPDAVDAQHFLGEPGLCLTAGPEIVCYPFDPKKKIARVYDPAGALVATLPHLDPGEGLWLVGGIALRRANTTTFQAIDPKSGKPIWTHPLAPPPVLPPPPP